MGVKPTRWYSNKQEKSIVKVMGGRQTPNSGAAKFTAGDVLLDDWLIEAKTVTSERSSFTIKKEWITKMREEQFAVGKTHSALAFSFGDGENHYVISETLFKRFVQLLDAEELT